MPLCAELVIYIYIYHKNKYKYKYIKLKRLSQLQDIFYDG